MLPHTHANLLQCTAITSSELEICSTQTNLKTSNIGRQQIDAFANEFCTINSVEMLRQHVGILGSRSLSVSALRTRRRVRRAIGLGEDVPAHRLEGDAPIWGERYPRGRLHSGLVAKWSAFREHRKKNRHRPLDKFYLTTRTADKDLDHVCAHPWINSSTVESTWFIWWPQWSRLATFHAPLFLTQHRRIRSWLPIESPVIVPAPPTLSLADASSAATRRVSHAPARAGCASRYRPPSPPPNKASSTAKRSPSMAVQMRASLSTLARSGRALSIVPETDVDLTASESSLLSSTLFLSAASTRAPCPKPTMCPPLTPRRCAIIEAPAKIDPRGFATDERTPRWGARRTSPMQPNASPLDTLSSHHFLLTNQQV